MSMNRNKITCHVDTPKGIKNHPLEIEVKDAYDMYREHLEDSGFFTEIVKTTYRK